MKVISSTPSGATDTLVVEKADKLEDILLYLQSKPATLTLTRLIWNKKTGLSSRLHLSRWFSDLESVTISPGVKEIGEMTFARCGHLKEVKLPEGLRVIKRRAFAHSALPEITLPKSISILGDGCFADCQHLESIEIPDEAPLTLIPEDFAHRSVLSSFHCPGNVKHIGRNAFRCTPLREIALNDGLELLEWGAFYATPLNTLRLPASLKAIRIPSDTLPPECHVEVDLANPRFRTISDALVDEEGTMLYYPAGEAEDGCFFIPEGVRFTSSELLNRLDATRFALPASFRFPDGALPYDVFPRETEHVSVNPSNPHLSAKDGVLYTAGLKKLLYFPPCHPAQDFVVPASVRGVGQKAFSTKINSVVFPSDVVMDNAAFYAAGIRSCVFHGKVESKMIFCSSCVFVVEFHSSSDSVALGSDSRVLDVMIPEEMEYDIPSMIKGLNNKPRFIIS